MESETRWYEERVKDWDDFTKLLKTVVTRYEGQQHHFFYRGQCNKKWRLESSLFRELKKKKNLRDFGISRERPGILWPRARQPPLPMLFPAIFKEPNLKLKRSFEIEKDAKKEFASQVHLYMDPSALPNSKDWLEWWALMQHYGAPTRLLDWTASPYVAAYFAVESDDETDGLIWVLNDWALGDRMQGQYSIDWIQWDRLPRPPNNWSNVAKSFKSKRFFDEDATPQIFFFQPDRRSPRVVAQQGWLSTSLRLDVKYETLIADWFDSHKYKPENQAKWDTKPWKYWNCRIVIPKEVKREFLRRLQTMNITASALYPGIDGLGKSVKEFIQVEVQHDKPGSSHSLP